MTVRERGLRAARRAARDLLKRWGVQRAADIEVEKMAAAVGVVIVSGPLHGARGRLKADSCPVIRIADTTVDRGAQRFTVAHELGHLLLGHPCRHVKRSEHGARRDDERDVEAEANAFATELLMPRALVAARCQHAAPSLDVTAEIANEFRTSLVATTIRFVELTHGACAVVYSERGRVRWTRKTFRCPPLAHTAGHPLPPLVLADLAAANDESPRRPRTAPADRWIATSIPAELQEHSAPIPETSGAITMLALAPTVAKALRTPIAT